jgi:hypothetical protein
LLEDTVVVVLPSSSLGGFRCKFHMLGAVLFVYVFVRPEPFVGIDDSG